uniref:Subunit VI of cytochrome b6/f complex n=1 Tax=Chloropicon mariensis TaxID=1606511 RepID=A0A4D6C4P8_9CHLO|nr:subunit VI of cytochrome b6/f complex [Chloropicon mariensis]QBX97833.1 subunit VI of cytochrome b6/f complex [Chloropicon mariensis]
MTVLGYVGFLGVAFATALVFYIGLTKIRLM